MSKRTPKEISPEALRRMKEIGNRIRQARKAKGINSVEFCHLHDINRMTLYRIENGEDTNLSSLLLILNSLGISIHEIFKGETEDLG